MSVQSSSKGEINISIKEIGVCSVVVIGGVVFGVSKGGLADALNDDIRPYQGVTEAERPEYMQSLVGEFSKNFDAYIVQTETFDYVGMSKFSADADYGLFEEVVSREEMVPQEELAAIKAKMPEDAFCAQDEMTMFTDKGWQYRFKLKHGNGRTIVTIVCHPTQNKSTA